MVTYVTIRLRNNLREKERGREREGEREREREGEREREREREKEREQGREINILNDYPGDRSGGGGPAIRLQLDCRLPRQEKTTH